MRTYEDEFVFERGIGTRDLGQDVVAVETLLVEADADLDAALAAAARVLSRGGMLGIDLVPDLPRWQEYQRHVSLEGPMRGGRRVMLIESVRQDRRRRLTIFNQEFVERHGRERAVHRFSLAFRTVTVPEVARRLECAGFTVDNARNISVKPMTSNPCLPVTTAVLILSGMAISLPGYHLKTRPINASGRSRNVL